MQEILFQNATLFTGETFLTGATVHVANGRIQEVADDIVPNDQATVVDLNGDYLIPGLIDLQLYGGSNLFLNEEPTPDTVRHIYESHASNGTTTLLPTIHSTSLEIMLQATAAVQVVRTEKPLGVPGIHIEGPYFNPIKRGAHSPAFVRTPAEGELETLFSTNADAIRILTLAPEIFSPEQLEVIRTRKHANTLLSLGHSNATYEQAMTAFSTDCPLATHLYNAMRGFESREPGIVGAVFDHATVRSSIIADGYHCDPVAIRVAYRLLGPDRLFLISDALFANPPRPEFTLGQFVVHHESDPNGPGRYVNNEGKLAGSAITLIDCVRVCVERVGLSLTDALRMATTTPAKILGLSDQIGHVAPGYVANLVRLDQALHVRQVWRA
ncbi:N-acetylglucosamine-6-phosphate deacetylase [Spirosoma taeanense]|uniref:N-acetylglucosamine-6-phosphate deacetylase n=1 Tax=Spirosoma taeanense TaxID=2735870 RepID=A0A6M5YA51_9BACT|nr:N-acetylglucosamine-6-phosphate deacetylase [Spirosoma taeanense]QJW89722.1 N-acetylglucosamine-6-phosphate deacetylase [Spirosoma taeanense]